MDLEAKLAVLADAAKYDASCASSGAPKRSSAPGRGMGSTTGMGICHSYTPDGRCVSLLKILLTNFCLYDCLYCINRRSSDVPRARFSVEEVVELTLSFYRRNYIEGLFLSSGIIRSADYTMEQLVEVARRLRQDHAFSGYIHLKTIPEASPTGEALSALAPEKNETSIKRAMGTIRVGLDESHEAGARAPKFAPAGQSTQVIVGADASTDAHIIQSADTLYRSYRLRRIYYSAFSPIAHSSSRLPNKAPPLMREHRLYQADWLMRFYGFATPEIVSAMPHGNLDLELDPKTSWALLNREQFPLDINSAERRQLLRVPGLGVKVVDRIVRSRAFGRLRYADLKRLGAVLRKARHFITTVDYHPPQDVSSQRLRAAVGAVVSPQQSLF
jgi:putative DNA modification/repair radical SAM protein